MIIIILILFGIISFFLINKGLKSTFWYKNQFVDCQKFMGKISNDLDIVNLGSTQPKYAFDYSNSKVNGANWAMGPQTFEYDLKILKQFHTHLKEGATVLIPVCPFKYFVFKYSSNSKYYSFLDEDAIDNFSQFRKMILHYPILTAKKQILRIVRDVLEDDRILLDTNPLDKDAIKNDAAVWINGWRHQFKIDNIDDFKLSEDNKLCIDNNIKKVKELLSFCKQHKYRPVFILLPATKELASYFSDDFVQKFIYENIQKSNITNAPILDYFRDVRFNDDNNYINSFFFNATGRHKFTRNLLSDLEKL